MLTISTIFAIMLVALIWLYRKTRKQQLMASHSLAIINNLQQQLQAKDQLMSQLAETLDIAVLFVNHDLHCVDIKCHNNSNLQQLCNSLLYKNIKATYSSLLDLSEKQLVKNFQSSHWLGKTQICCDNWFFMVNDTKFLLLIKDTTQQQQLEQAVVQPQKLALLGSVVQNIIPQLNTNITTMREMIPVNHKLANYLDKTAAMLNHITLLALTRSNQLDSFDFGKFIEKFISFAAKLLGNDITITCNSCPQLYVNYNKVLLTQVLLNIIMNAKEAINGNGAIRLELQNVTKRGKFAKLTITDDGAGIKKQHLSQIFEPFFTTKNPNQNLGLGLYAVKNILNANNSEIEVNCNGNGTSVTLWIPATSSLQTMQQA